MSILKIKDSKGNWVGIPTVKGDKGNTGNGISSAVLNDDYTLTLTFTDGTTYKTPSIRGEKGEKGEPATDMEIHICSASEYDSETRVPTIANPNDKTFYLVPTEDGTSPDLFTEWVYVNNAWEMFGSMKIDLSGYLTDVQINGTSIVENGVANVPIAGSGIKGVVSVINSYGLKVVNGNIAINRATGYDFQNANNNFRPIVTSEQHNSVFYGLAKSAGDTTQSQSSNAVGVYTDEAKIAIQKMLGIYEPPYELLNDFTLDEEGGFDLTADANDTPYDLRNVLIHVYYPANLTAPTTGYGRYRCFDSNKKACNAETGRYTANTAVKYKYISFERKANLTFAVYTSQESVGGAGIWRTKNMYASSNAGSGITIDLGNIVRIACIDLEPAGTQIKIYGQRAY